MSDSRDLTIRRDRYLAMEEAARRGDVVKISKLLTDELIDAQKKLKDTVWIVTCGQGDERRGEGRIVAVKGSSESSAYEIKALIRSYRNVHDPNSWKEDFNHCTLPVKDWVNADGAWIRIVPWGVT